MLRRCGRDRRVAVRRASFLLSLIAFSLFASLPARADGPLPGESYARAERFLTWNAERYVRNGNIRHHWIRDKDRFWYQRTVSNGDREFVLVDAATGRQTRAFDQRAIAIELTRLSGQAVAANHLPFSYFRYRNNGSEIGFEFSGRKWTCNRLEAACRASPSADLNMGVPSPDGRWEAFVRDHNIWVRDVGNGQTFALTSDGIEDYGYADSPGYSTHSISDIRHPGSGAPAILWSPDSRYVLTHRLDQRDVKRLYLVQSVPEDGAMRPKLYEYRYPMPGDPHWSQLQPVILDVIARRMTYQSAKPVSCSVATLITQHNTWWSEDGKFVYYLDRDRFSKHVSLEKVDAAAGTAQTLIEETSDTVVQTNADSPYDPPAVRTLRSGETIWYSQRSGWGHLYLYDAAGALRNQITHGNWVVRSVVHVDEAARRIYFTASGREGAKDPYAQHLYRIRFDGSHLQLLTPEEGTHELPQVAPEAPQEDPLGEENQRFSPSGRYFVDSYSQPHVPPVFELRSADGRLVKRLEEADISKLREGGYVPIEPFEVLAADGKTAIYGNLFRPSNFDSSRRYPVIDAAYQGPQGLRTKKTFMGAEFDYFEAQSLAELGFIVITIDGRGTPLRSKAFLDHSYGHMARANDLQDHVAGIRELADKYPYMDLTRVGVDGASGGGYAAAHAILEFPDFYKVAVSAEGNHDQRGYLAPWGETYMGAIDQGDYEEASNLPLAAKLKGRLLLVHGDMDDNVSPALTLKLADALIRSNKNFDMLIIPNENHALFSTSPYYIRRKWDYFEQYLLGAEPPQSYRISGPGQ